MSERTERLFSVLIGIIIISYGVMGNYALPIYQNTVENLLGDNLVDKISAILNGNEYTEKDMYNLGKYLMYYPSYLILHLGLISILFWNKPQSRSFGVLAIIIGIPLVAFLSFLFYRLNWITMHRAAFSTFKTFVSYPFVLFLVEGGRLLDKNIDELIKKTKM